MGDIGKVQAGITAFAPYPAPTYRFVISSEADKLRVLLEDRNSKKQWCTKDLEKSDFLTTMNTIPNVAIADYVPVFQGALDHLMGAASDLDDSDNDSSGSDEDDEKSDEEDGDENSDGEVGEKKHKEDADDDTSDDQITSQVDPKRIRRQLNALEGGALQLELTDKLRVLDSAWATKYIFRLEPVALDRLDILESKLRDVQEELGEIKRMLKENEKD
ncbi:hypothetical protein GN244_ATG17003 [Phytophthora infestans]|uniref:Uncharacterized protein n=1 Tax=Phytophthora infestans TaxID=4787 RepID=A0A833WLM8_PHYIN|nr:hypothetical protein GN244_ATG17003 [Phytophthora infestans]KAF4137772.1 hypothetical protein GN958_ATG13055 [Phytophthora infestans]